MTTVKSYTDLEQSHKLAEILPKDTADMFLALNGTLPVVSKYIDNGFITADDTAIPCWSIAALLSVLPKGTNIIKEEADTENEQYMCTVGIKNAIISTFGNNPIDACIDMIEKLHELKML